AREMLTNNLFGAISFDTLGSRIPTRHIAVRVEHKHRIILRALYQQTKLFLALAQRPFGLATISNITEHEHDAGHFADRIPNRRGTVINRSLRAVFGNQ